MKKEKPSPKYNINNIKNPDFVKSLTLKDLEVLAKDIREKIIEHTAFYGGHLSSNLGAVEATIALCRHFDFLHDKILFDVGHQCYTYKILTGRSLVKLRHKGGVSGFQKRNESPYDCFEAGHSSTAISAANGMAIARDLNNEKYDVIAFVGDASIVNGLSFEGLNNIAQENHKVIIILNDNDMSISKPVGGISKFFRRISTNSSYIRTKDRFRRLLYKSRIGMIVFNFLLRVKNSIKHFLIPTTLFDNMGYLYLGPLDGHNFKEMDKAIKRAKKSRKSVIIHLRTKKGKGFNKAENDMKGKWHGVSPFDIETGESLSIQKKPSWSDIYSNFVLEAMKINPKIVLATPATIQGSSLEEIFKEYPKRCIDVGIAEEHCVTMSSGLALSGFHPIISIYSTFLQRAYDEVLHDLARMHLDSTILIDRTGLVGRDGDTHQGIFDTAFLLSIPDINVSMASDSSTAKGLFEQSIVPGHGVSCIRYPRDWQDDTYSPVLTPFGKWRYLKKGNDIAVISYGPLIKALLERINDLNITLIDALYQKPLDSEMIDSLLDYSKVLIYDPYGIEGGFPSQLTEELVKRNFKGSIFVKAIPCSFIGHASINEQLEDLSLRPIDINDFIRHNI